MKITLKEGDSLPMWYACAHYDYFTCTKAAYPIGIHIVVRYVRKFYYWMAWVFARKDMKRMREIFDEGYEAGYRAGEQSLLKKDLTNHSSSVGGE